MQLNVEGLAARLYEPLLSGVLGPLRREVVALCPANGKVLDCCCGPGGLARMLDSAGRSVTGVDLSPVMLHEARRNAPGVKLLEADATSLPFADGEFAAAAVCLALHAMPPETAEAVLRELTRVARTVIVADYCLPERNMWLPAVTLAHAVERLVGGEHYRCYRAFMARGGLEGLLGKLGLLPNIRVHVLGGGATVALVCPHTPVAMP